jgi:hypothetical protein
MSANQKAPQLARLLIGSGLSYVLFVQAKHFVEFVVKNLSFFS